jgi:hypothetical protein
MNRPGLWIAATAACMALACEPKVPKPPNPPKPIAQALTAALPADKLQRE